jgi:secreted trypsin-like serine protease
MLRLFLTSLIVCLLASCADSSNSSEGPENQSVSTNACSQIGLNTKVINGTACEPLTSPVVKIVIINNDNTAALCSGTMISSRDVLTAAHCFLSPDLQSAFIEVQGRRVVGSTAFIHPLLRFDSFVGAVFNDVAIMRLNESVNLSPLPLLLSQNVKSGDVISIYGYGLDENQNEQVLKSGQMKLSTVTPNHLFAPYNGTGSNACFGDSGGPAYYTATLETGETVSGIVGIVSSGNNQDCSKGDVTLFANTQGSSILDFITQIVPEVIVQ